MATWGHSVVRRAIVLDGEATGGTLLPEQDTAYEYLCRLEEAKKYVFHSPYVLPVQLFNIAY